MPAEAAPAQAPLGPNPSFRIDEALGIIVMQLHDASGKVASTIPTAQQLNAYRRTSAHETAGTTPAAAGTPGTGTTTQGATAKTASPVPSSGTTPAVG